MKMEFDEIPNGFSISLSYNKQKTSTSGKNEGANEGANEGVNEGVNELLSLVLSHPGSRGPFFATKMGVPAKTIERWLKILRRENKIEFKGAFKTGGYYII